MRVRPHLDSALRFEAPRLDESPTFEGQPHQAATTFVLLGKGAVHTHELFLVRPDFNRLWASFGYFEVAPAPGV